MEGMDVWQLCFELSIVQAALLMVGEDPSLIADYVESNSPEYRPPGYEAAKTAIIGQLRSEGIKGRWVERSEYNRDGDFVQFLDGTIDLHASRIDVVSLRVWLDFMDFDSEFFGTGSFGRGRVAGPDYLNPSHPRYAPKLAAAVRAWQALETEPLAGKSPKQALMDWLTEHATELGLIDDSGKPNKTGIEEVAKVANWQPGGGAPKTPF